MTLAQGCLAIAISNLMLLVGLGLWNSELHWVIGCVAMFFLVVSWVMFWEEDVREGPEEQERDGFGRDF